MTFLSKMIKPPDHYQDLKRINDLFGILITHRLELIILNLSAHQVMTVIVNIGHFVSVFPHYFQDLNPGL